jgi:hypothetical protein
MRAALLAALVVLAGCAAAGDGSQAAQPTTGLVLSLHFDHYDVEAVTLSGATFASSRRFGPYVVSENDLPRDSTVGFVFDPGDEGTAMVCAQSHDVSGNMLQSGCDTFDIVSAAVTKGSLTLVDPFSSR